MSFRMTGHSFQGSYTGRSSLDKTVFRTWPSSSFAICDLHKDVPLFQFTTEQ